MPALVKVTPGEFKAILLLDGWRIYQEDAHNWSLVKGDESLEIPKRGRLITFAVMEHAFAVAEMPPGRYLELRAQVLAAGMPKTSIQ